MNSDQTMDSWRILDKNEYAEDYRPTVCLDDVNSNFSITVSAVLENEAKSTPPVINSFIRPPFIAICVEQAILILNTDDGETILFKKLNSLIKSFLIRKKRNSLILYLESDQVIAIDLDNGSEVCIEASIPKENFALTFLIEQENESIILVNNKSSIFPNYLLMINNDLAEITVFNRPIKNEDLECDTLFEIEMMRSKRCKLFHSSLHVKPSAEGNLEIFCPITSQSFIIDNALNVLNVKSFNDCSKLMLLSVSEKSECNLSIVDFFGMNLEFNINVGNNCVLIGGLKDFALYGEIKQNKLYVYVVKEISPICQLEMLIALQNYEGAENFAKANHLSPAAVLEIKAKCLLNSLRSKFSFEGLYELENILKSHDNVEFIVNCSCEGVKSNIELFPLLEFSKNKLLNNNNVKLNKKIDDLLWRTDAFRLLKYEFVDESFKWEDFVNESAVNLCKRFIIADMLDCATIVWMKSYRSVAYTLKVRDVADMLCSISLDTKLNSLLRWLEYFIPSINSIMPYSADIIITWAKDRICVLENSVHWPEVAIQFAEKFSNLMFNSPGLISFIPPLTEKVYYLINCMTQIQTLKNKYNIPVSLKDFTTLNGNELAKLILRKAFTEDLECLLKQFLEEFIIKHNLNHDNLIHEYIEEVISLSPSIDEIRMDILLNSMYNADEKYQCVIIVLKSATVPWSKNIKRIVDNAIASQHVLVPKIQMEIIHADIRGILMKYKCHDLDSDNFEYLIQAIIEKGEPDMMNDIEKVTTIYSRLKEDAYLLCIQNYIELNNVNKALEVYNNIENTYKTKCVEALILILDNQLSYHNMNKQLELNYIDFLKAVEEADEKMLASLTNIYVLKNRFNVLIPYRNYCIEEYRKVAFINYCKKTFGKSSNVQNLKHTFIKSVQLGQYLLYSKIDCIVMFVDQCSSDIFAKLANITLADTSNFLMKDVKSVDLILKLIPMVNVADITLIENCIKYLSDVIKECDPKSLVYCIDVISWLSSLYYAHNNTREVLNMWNISPLYNPHIVNPIIPVWKEVFLRNTIDNFKTKSLSMCLCTVNEKCVNGSNCLPSFLNKCQAQQNDIHFLRIIAYCCNLYLNTDRDIPNWLNDLNDSMIKVLLSKMINLEILDHLLISVLLFSYSNPTEWLSDVLKNPIQRNKKANVAHHILQCRDMYYHINIPYAQAYNLYSQNIIENKLEYNGIALKSDHEGSYNLSVLLESFISMKSCNFEILEEFCIVANMDLDKILIYYLFYLLKWWNDDYIFVYDNFGKCTILPSENQNQVMENCKNIIKKIKQKDQLVMDLTLLFKNGEINIGNLSTVNLNLYCYEAYIFILDLIKNITGTHMFLREYMLLKFLQTYQRATKPKQSELDEFSMKENFPKIGFYRLPFCYVIGDNFWSNLKSEVTLETYKQWLSIAGLLSLNIDIQVTRDMICSNAVKQSMTKQKTLNEGTNIKWTLHLKNDRLLKEAYECVQHITNLEWAGACFYYVFQGSALGADQVAAVDMCYQFAEHWAKVEPNHNVVKKMQMKHLLTSSAHVLHKIGLAEDKLLALCDNPHRLIEALYNHKSIVTRYECPNINNAVDEIAEKHNLDAGVLRLRMLEKILNINNAPSSDSSINKSMLINDGSLSKDLLMKACYILKGSNQTMATIYLTHIGLRNNDVDSNVSLTQNVRALQCLLSLADSEVIENVTNYKLNDLWSKLWDLYFINGLNLIGVEYLIPSFHEDKMQIIQQLWHSRNRSHLVIVLIIKMLIIYNIQIDDSLLNDIIGIINKFDMIFEVKHFLLSVKLMYSPNYLDMWARVLLTPFKRLDVPLTNHQKDECFEALKFLPLCPVANQIDLSLIWKNCICVNAIDMAVIVLPHLSKTNTKELVNKIGKIKKSTLQDLKLLKAKGILTTNSVLGILKYELNR